MKPEAGTTSEFCKAKTWQEAAYIAKECCINDENSRALVDHAYAATETVQYQQGGKGSYEGKGNKKGEKGGKEGGKGGKKDRIYVADGMPSDDSGACFVCKRDGHSSKLCPRKAAEKRGEVEGLLADHAKTGAVCQICSSIGQKNGDHRARSLLGSSRCLRFSNR